MPRDCGGPEAVDPGSLLRQTRRASGLSAQDLGRRAGIAPSTISRIEAGEVDPAVGVLARLMEAAGHCLHLAVTSARPPRLEGLTDAWETSARGDLVSWTRLRAFLDHLAEHPDQVPQAIEAPPAPSGSALLDNLLAGIAETLADEQGMARPTWTSQVPPLEKPWVTPGTPTTQDSARSRTPRALAARGVTLTRGSLWRDRTGTGDSPIDSSAS